MKISISLVEQAPVDRPTCRGPTQCKRSPWTIKGRVYPIEGASILGSHSDLHKD
jgi:hypothetical protein